MKRIIFFCAFCLAILSCGGKKDTLTNKENDFKVKDTANVDKIFLANKGGQSVLLIKEGRKWTVNQEFEARGDMLANLMYCIRNVEVKQFVPKTAIENTMKLLSVSATKVEIYVKGKLNKTYYVGGPTQDHFGTYMVMEDAETPHICYLPGHRGYLTNFYTPLPDEWKSRQIFNYRLEEIGSIRTDFYRAPEMSWEIINVDNKKFKLKSVATDQFVENFDTSVVKMVVKEFKAMGFESFANPNAAHMDSVKAKYKLYRITVTDKLNRKKTLDLYAMPLPPGTYTMDGKPAIVDVDRMYGIIDSKTITVCQYYTYDPITIPIFYFTGQKPENMGYPGR